MQSRLPRRVCGSIWFWPARLKLQRRPRSFRLEATGLVSWRPSSFGDLGAMASWSSADTSTASTRDMCVLGQCKEVGAPEVRLWAVSDIHTDSRENWEWAQGLSDTDYAKDALIVAGDVSHHARVIEGTLRTLAQKFDAVFFTPGNHDLWLDSEDQGMDSIDKLHRLTEMCDELGVHTTPARIGVHGGNSIWVCPLLSWHHKSFDEEPDLLGWDIPSVEQSMVDYQACHFPQPLNMLDDSVAQAMDALNDGDDGRRLDQALSTRDETTEPLVTFSHFLPRPELLLEKRFLTLPQLPKAAGSRFLRERVERLRPDVHVFGHTHFGWDAVLDGIRYIQAALAYPGERRERWPSLAVGNLGPRRPLLLWSSDSGFVPKMHCRWSGYYEHHKREPNKVFDIAHYAAGMFRQIDSRATVCFPDFSHDEAYTRSAGSNSAGPATSGNG